MARRQCYWTVVEAPQGLGHPRMRITVPPGLNLLIFAAGALACNVTAWETLRSRPDVILFVRTCTC